MAGLTSADYDYLDNLGIRSVCDFRTAGERRSEPNKWVGEARINYWTRDYEMSGGDLAKLFTGRATGEQARATMAEMYRELPYEQAPAYREMFRKMIAGKLPLAFNCSAGKDRAGLAAALVLTALGVPRKTVFADYELTNRYLRAALTRDKANDAMLSKLPKDIIGPVLAADPLYIRTAFDEMTKRDGSPEAYLRKVVGLSEQDQIRLKRALLE
jgi:protein-tyrosine phosphatase